MELYGLIELFMIIMGKVRLLYVYNIFLDRIWKIIY